MDEGRALSSREQGGGRKLQPRCGSEAQAGSVPLGPRLTCRTRWLREPLSRASPAIRAAMSARECLCSTPSALSWHTSSSRLVLLDSACGGWEGRGHPSGEAREGLSGSWAELPLGRAVSTGEGVSAPYHRGV